MTRVGGTCAISYLRFLHILLSIGIAQTLFVLWQVLHKEAAQTCRRHGVVRTGGACTGPRRVLVLSLLARRAHATVGPRVPGVARAVSAGVSCCIHVRTDAHTHVMTRTDA